jgi:hypothetical protein
MAQRIVKDCFGSEDLPKDKDIFRYELKLLQCIEFNINHIQNPIPVSSYVNHSIVFTYLFLSLMLIVFD